MSDQIEENNALYERAKKFTDRYIYLAKITGKVTSTYDNWTIAGKPDNLGNLRVINLWKSYKDTLLKYLSKNGIKVSDQDKIITFYI
jgi:hypothetical protein